MRVTTGKSRGVKLATLEGLDTRPTADRVKQAIFNIIQAKITNSNVLDLFAGSGALGIEALSRGAASCRFVDSNPRAVDVINSNLKKTDLAGNAVVMCETFGQALNCGLVFDIVFLDPPYNSDLLEQAITAIIENNCLANQGIIVCEHQRDEDLNDMGLEVIKSANYGKTTVTILSAKEIS